jgi:hypothetical protein
LQQAALTLVSQQVGGIVFADFTANILSIALLILGLRSSR